MKDECITKTSGNAAAMLEALKKIGAMEIPHNFQIERSDIVDACYDLTKAIKIANAALSEPPRNCDVGTAEEQAERYGRYCDKFTQDGMHCESCQCCGKIQFGKCEFAWSQMSYEADAEKEGGAE